MTENPVQAQNATSVQRIYEAFAAGDTETILGLMHPEVDWDYAWNDSPIPWLKPGRGKDHAAAFFATMARDLEFLRFSVNRIATAPDVVIALVSLEVIVRSTGKHFVETDEAHIWYFNDEGLVTRFRHAADTLQQYRALQG